MKNCDGDTNRNKTTEGTVNVTVDQPVFDSLQHQELPPDSGMQEQARIRNRAKNFRYQSGEHYKNKGQINADRLVPNISERRSIMTSIHYLVHPRHSRSRRLVHQDTSSDS